MFSLKNRQILGTEKEFSIRDFFSNVTKSAGNLVTFTEEILNVKLLFFVQRICATIHMVNPKTAGGINLTPPCGFSKSVSSKEREKPWFFVTFNIILRHIFPENFIEFPQVV